MGAINVFTAREYVFRDRRHAAEMLSGELADYKNREKLIIVGIPRGGVIIAEELARSLDAELDIVLTRKMRAPFNPELAVGAVSEDGRLYLDKNIVASLGLTNEYIEEEKTHQLNEIDRGKKLYRAILEKKELKDFTVILTDDGAATGSTMQAAIWAAAAESHRETVVALPTAPPETLKQLAEDVDRIVCFCAPRYFQAISQFYSNFEQIPDERIVELLQRYKISNKQK